MIVGDGPARTRPARARSLAREPKPGPLRADALHKLAYLVTDDSALRLAEQAHSPRSGGGRAMRADISTLGLEFAAMGGRHADGAAVMRRPPSGTPRRAGSRSCSPRRSAHRVPPPERRRRPPARDPPARGRARARGGRSSGATTRRCEILGIQLTWSASSPRRVSSDRRARARPCARLPRPRGLRAAAARRARGARRAVAARGAATHGRALELTLGSEHVEHRGGGPLD